MPETKCEACGRPTPSFQIIQCGSIERGYKALCRRCFNNGVARAGGLDDFEHLEFDPIRLNDSDGKSHEFHFRTFLFGTGVALDAFELREGVPAGYQFQVIADPQEDLLAMLGRLIAKIQRAISVKHLEEGELGLQITGAGVVRGLIDWDAEGSGATPLLIIDGREISWEDFGRFLTSFEGFQFKLEIRDKSEKI